MALDIDVIIDADPASAIRRTRKARPAGPEHRPVELFEQLAPRHAEPPYRPLVIELDQELPDGVVQFHEAVEAPVPQAPENPTLHDRHARLDLRLVARAARPRRQDRGVVMRRHLGIGAVDRRLVEARLDDRSLRVVGDNQPGNPADRLERSGVGADPIVQRLGPVRLGVSEVRGTHDGDKDLRPSGLAGQPLMITGTVSPA